MRSTPTTRWQLPRRLMVGAAALCAVLFFAAVADAHDFWLVPNAFHVAAGEYVDVRGQTSSDFPTSESAVALDRVADARLIGAGGEERITGLSHTGTSLRLRHRARNQGQYVVAVALHPRSMRESTAGFRRYLELEGAPDALARIDREGLLHGRDSVTRRYAKYAKTVVQVGAGGPRAFARAAGHPLEFMTDQDPAALKVGDTLSVRLLYRGRPLSGVKVHAGGVAPDAPRGPAASSNASSSRGPNAPDLELTTDGSGRLAIPMTRAGLWNVRTLHIVQADAGSGADWDTHWATIVFPVAARPEARSLGRR